MGGKWIYIKAQNKNVKKETMRENKFRVKYPKDLICGKQNFRKELEKELILK